MKKIFVCLVAFCLFTSTAMAQKFSSSLGGGADYERSRATTNSPQKEYGKVKKTYNRKGVIKTVLRYTPSQVRVSDAQEKQIMPIIRRIQEGRTIHLEIVGIARDYNSVYHRMNTLRLLFVGYTPNILPTFRQVTGAAVFNSNDNTVEIYEYY